jgi:3-deoxy-7-phosphoheptulonate synthase
MLQVGARNMQNVPLLAAVAETGKPVLLKRGASATIGELLSAAEYLAVHGNTQVVLCERGIRTFESATRNTLDIAAVPVLKHATHLPVFVDPSHAAGDARYVRALARAALAAGADGLLVEVHPSPGEALSDGPQSLTLEAFHLMMQELSGIASAVGRSLGTGGVAAIPAGAIRGVA